jgi:hypothetical protein
MVFSLEHDIKVPRLIANLNNNCFSRSTKSSKRKQIRAGVANYYQSCRSGSYANTRSMQRCRQFVVSNATIINHTSRILDVLELISRFFGEMSNKRQF